MKRVTTITGSVYLIDIENHRWERIVKTGESGPSRTESGSILNNGPVTIEIGQPMRIVTDNLSPDADLRMILTSEVISIVDI